jgi:hypothetical protein
MGILGVDPSLEAGDNNLVLRVLKSLPQSLRKCNATGQLAIDVQRVRPSIARHFALGGA